MKRWQKCVVCGADFIPRNTLSVLCGNPECRKKREAEQKKAYNKRNPVIKVVRKKDVQMNQTKSKEIACIRCVSKDNSPYQLDLLVGSHIVPINKGPHAMAIYDAIHDQVQENGQIGYDLIIKPYDCDHMVEGKSFSIMEIE